MSETPPPIPGAKASIAPLWSAWLLTSTVLPMAPFIILRGKALDGSAGAVMIIIALVCQLAASIWLAIGFSRQRHLGTGSIVAMSFVFFLSSVAIGTAVFFAACLAAVNLDFK